MLCRLHRQDFQPYDERDEREEDLVQMVRSCCTAARRAVRALRSAPRLSSERLVHVGTAVIANMGTAVGGG